MNVKWRALSWYAFAVLPLTLFQCSGSSDAPEATGKDAGRDGSANDGADAAPDADAAHDVVADVVQDSPDSAIVCTERTQRFVVNAIILPLQRSDYAIDLNGDGNVDNQLGNVNGALSANNLDSQSTMDAAIAAGEALLLLDETSNDPAFQLDPSCARAGLQQAVVAPNPNFAGTGTFTPDTTSPRGAFTGTIANGAFDATAPATMATPVALDVKLAIAGALVRLPVVGAHVSFVSSNGNVTGGKIQGVVRKTDVDNVVIPQIASTLNAAAEVDGSSAALQILSIFDVGGCLATDTNFDGSPAVANDGKIATCEVANNSIIKNVLSADVQMFDANGNYQPNPANTLKDSISLAFGFTAVPAQF